jgi:gliding motility-associated-like protein
MKNLILYALLLLFSLGAAAQVVTPQQYQQMKAAGTLQNETVLPSPEERPVVHYKPQTKPAGKEKAGGCDCYVEPDASYILALEPQDDSPAGDTINLPFEFSFYGVNYNQLHINNNGNVTFINSLSQFSSTAFPSVGPKIIAPFWADVDTRPAANDTLDIPLGSVVYKLTPTALYVNWLNVGYFSQQGDKRNTFQLILTDGTDPAVSSGNVAFCYQDMDWTTGSASGGINGFGGVPATAGTNKGNGQGYWLIARFDHPGNDYDGATGNTDGIDWLDYKSFYFNVSDTANIPPISSGVTNCDTIKVCALGDTADIPIIFLSPELNQLTTITFDDGGSSSVSEINNIPGNTAFMILRAVGDVSQVGYHNITVTGTDNGTPPASTTLTFVVWVDTMDASNLNPILTPDGGCDEVTMSVLNGPYDTYLWDNLSVYPTTNLGDAGDFGVTVSRNGCYKRVHKYIQIVDPIVVNLQGDLILCPGEEFTDLEIPDSLKYSSVSWSLTNNPARDTMYVNQLIPGDYTITLHDTSGYCMKDTLFTVHPTLKLRSDTAVCTSSYFFTTNIGGIGVGSWSFFNSAGTPEFLDSTILNTIVTFPVGGVYNLIFIDNYCNAADTVVMTYHEPPVFALSSDFYVCHGDLEYLFIPDSLEYTAVSWGVTNPAQDTLFSVNLPGGVYSAELSNINCTIDTLFEIISQPLIVLEDSIVACDPDYEFQENTGGSGFGEWTFINSPGTPVFSDSSDLNPSVIFPITGTYTLIYSDLICPDADSTEIIYAEKPVFGLSSDFFVCQGVEEYLFVPDSLAMSSITWGLSDMAQDTLYSVNLPAGTYTSTLTTLLNCSRDTTFTILSQPPVFIYDYEDACGDSLSMTLNTGIQTGLWTQLSGPGPASFVSPTSLNTSVEITEYGTYEFVFTESTCNDSDTLEILYTPYPWFDINGGITCAGEPYTFTSYDLGFIEDYMWSTGTVGPALTITGAGPYTLVGSNSCGAYSETVYLVEETCDIEMPNIFSPNGDGSNPVFQVIDPSGGFAQFKCQIFNRWGNLIYEFNDIHGAWDGKNSDDTLVDEGSYFYNISATTINGKKVEKQGFVQVIRD